MSITGGLSGDGTDFAETWVIADDAAGPKRLAAVGLYGDDLRVGYASMGGWGPFGPLRTITRAEGNVLYELDGRSALDLYKTYLGDHANQLPGSACCSPSSSPKRRVARVSSGPSCPWTSSRGL